MKIPPVNKQDKDYNRALYNAGLEDAAQLIERERFTSPDDIRDLKKGQITVTSIKWKE